MHGAVKENRTPVPSLDGWCSTIELLPHIKWLVVFTACMPLAWAPCLSPRMAWPLRSKWWEEVESNHRSWIFSPAHRPRMSSSHMVGEARLELATALSIWFTVRGDTNYTVLAHIGGTDGTWTHNLFLARELRSQLRHGPMLTRKVSHVRILMSWEYTHELLRLNTFMFWVLFHYLLGSTAHARNLQSHHNDYWLACAIKETLTRLSLTYLPCGQFMVATPF